MKRLEYAILVKNLKEDIPWFGKPGTVGLACQMLEGHTIFVLLDGLQKN